MATVGRPVVPLLPLLLVDVGTVPTELPVLPRFFPHPRPLRHGLGVPLRVLATLRALVLAKKRLVASLDTRSVRLPRIVRLECPREMVAIWVPQALRLIPLLLALVVVGLLVGFVLQLLEQVDPKD